MNRDAKQFLIGLLTTPSPSGSEQRVQHAVYEYAKGFADTIEPDVHGNLLIGINTQAKRRVLLAGHCDQIGFLVKHIDADGYLTIEALGGADEGVLPGAQVIVLSKHGSLPGVVARKVSHLQTKQEKNNVPLLSEMWVDIGAKDRKDAQARVCAGDYVVFRLGVQEMANNLLVSPGLDNKAGLFVALETLRTCANSELDIALYVVSTVQEEIGARGAATATNALRPDVGLAIDVTIATDDPGGPKNTSLPCRLGHGPTISSGPNTNPMIARLLREAAERAQIPYQLAPSGELEGNDSKAIQVSDSGIATASVGIPNRNMHTPIEVCSLDDLDATVRLVSEFARRLRHDTELRPFYFADDTEQRDQDLNKDGQRADMSASAT
jgi:putative aminopeptidase FrvX